MNDKCPYCGEKIEMNTDIHDEKAEPIDGDAGICLYCQGIFKFENGERIKADINEFPSSTQMELLELKDAIMRARG